MAHVPGTMEHCVALTLRGHLLLPFPPKAQQQLEALGESQTEAVQGHITSELGP